MCGGSGISPAEAIEVMSTTESPSHRDIVLSLVGEHSEPDTCAAIELSYLIKEIGDREAAENAVRTVWREGLIEALASEVDSEDGALYGVRTPRLNEKLRDRTRFALTSRGYASVGRLYQSDLFQADSFQSIDEATSQESVQVVTVTAFLNEMLIQEIKKHPDQMLKLSPREFEMFVAELFAREGFDVELTPPSRDGGCDILAVSNSDLGSHYTLYNARGIALTDEWGSSTCVLFTACWKSRKLSAEL